MFAKRALKSARRIEPHVGISGYHVAIFDGRMNPGAFVDCFAFSRYGGTVNAHGGFGGTPGYPAGALGAYCTGLVDVDFLSDEKIARVLGALRVPAD